MYITKIMHFGNSYVTVIEIIIKVVEINNLVTFDLLLPILAL